MFNNYCHSCLGVVNTYSFKDNLFTLKEDSKETMSFVFKSSTSYTPILFTESILRSYKIDIEKGVSGVDSFSIDINSPSYGNSHLEEIIRLHPYRINYSAYFKIDPTMWQTLKKDLHILEWGSLISVK